MYRHGNWRGRITTPKRAVFPIHSGQRVYEHNGCAEPLELVRALTRRGLELHDVEVVRTLPEYEGHIRHNSLFTGGNVRAAVQERRADYTPVFLSEIEGLFCWDAMPIEVGLLQATPPDHCGYLNLGSIVDYSPGGRGVRATRHDGNQQPGAAHAWRNSTSREPSGGIYRDVASGD